MTDGRTFPRVIPRPARVGTHGDPHGHSSAHSCSDMDGARLDRAMAGGWSKVGYRGRTICGLWSVRFVEAGCGPCRTARSAARVENHSHDSGLTSVRTNSPKWRHHRRLQRGRGAPGEVLSCSISNPKLTRPAFASDCKSLCPAFVLALCPIRPAWPLVPNRAVDCRSCHPGTSGGIPFDLFHCPGGPSTSFRSRLPCLCRNRSPSRNLSFRWATRHSRKLQSDRNLPVCLRRSRWPAIVAIVE